MWIIRRKNGLFIKLLTKFQGDKKKKKLVKYIYKTADELIATGGKKKTVVHSDLAKVKVIDMTGKEKRVLSGEIHT